MGSLIALVPAASTWAGTILTWGTSVDAFLYYGMLIQAGYSGFSSVGTVGFEYEVMQRLCRNNYNLVNEGNQLAAMSKQGEIDSIMIQRMQDVVNRWSADAGDAEDHVVKLRTHFLHNYVFFLWCLAGTVLMLYIAIEKKSGRLHKLFQKIDRISAVEAATA